MNNENIKNPIRTNSNKKYLYVVLVLLIAGIIFLTNLFSDNASKEIE